MKRKIKWLALLTIAFTQIIYAQNINIVDKPIIYDSLRINLSLQYLKERHQITQDTPTIIPRMIVVHWTAASTFASTFTAFNKSTFASAERKDIAGVSNLNVSSQFLVDRDGTIYRLMPEDYFARHTIGLNYCAIGIENVGSAKFPLTEKQLQANIELVKYLSSKYQIEYLIGHYEYKKFKDTQLWKETNAAYLTDKYDPDAAFMQNIRAATQYLQLKGAPN